MSQIIQDLTDSNFQNEVCNSNNKKNELFLIDFWAEWCNPCTIIAAILKEIAIEYNDKLKIAKLNIDANPIITKTYGIRSIPTLLLIKNGTVLSTKIGLLSKQQLQKFLDTYV